ncbi:MAG TPA: DUF1816 domain-containing protein [Stenomitos sp.]
MNCTQDFAATELAVGWWIEAFTTHPTCIYYFGPFETPAEADLAQEEYLDPLRQEGIQIIAVRVRHCQPRQSVIRANEVTIQELETGPLLFFEALVL